MFWGLSESFDLYAEYAKGLKNVRDNNGSTTQTHCGAKFDGASSKIEECALKTQDINPEPKNIEEVKQESNAELNIEEIQENIAGKTTAVPETSATRQDGGQGAHSNAASEEGDKQPFISDLNILLLGAGDVRHILCSIAKRYQHKDPVTGALPRLNFYIIDACMELNARNLALLGIALEQPEAIGLRNRVHLFMDVFGNSLLRPTSHMYLVGKSKALLNMVTDLQELQKRAPYIHLEHLKYRERDALENTFEFWQPKPEHVYNIHSYWEQRVRQHLGARYDHREGAYDWDLTMTLKYRNAQQICSQEYRYWRETGIAFTFPEYEQCKPNKTLCMSLSRNGRHYQHRGYIGDIQTGPFCSYGLQCYDSRYSHSNHGANDYRATDVTERNLYELFHELQNQTHYEHNEEWSRKYGSVRLQMGKTFIWNENDLKASMDYDREWLPLEGVHLYYLSPEELSGMSSPHSRWHNFFDVIFVAHSYHALLKRCFLQLLRLQGLLLLETKLLTLVRKEQLVEFEKKLKELAQSGQLDMVVNYNALNTHFSVMKFRRNMPPQSAVTNEQLENMQMEQSKVKQMEKKEKLKLPEFTAEEDKKAAEVGEHGSKLEENSRHKSPKFKDTMQVEEVVGDQLMKGFDKLKTEMRELLQTKIIEKEPINIVTRQNSSADIKESEK